MPGIEVEEDVAATAWPQGVSKLKKTKSCLQAEEGSLRAGNGEETGKKWQVVKEEEEERSFLFVG